MTPTPEYRKVERQRENNSLSFVDPKEVHTHTHIWGMSASVYFHSYTVERKWGKKAT